MTEPEQSATVEAPVDAAKEPETSPATATVPVQLRPPPIFSLAKLLREEESAKTLFEDNQIPRIRVVDVGAMHLAECEDVWGPLRRLDLCESITGFECCEDECKKLNRINETKEKTECAMQFLPHAIGDGSSCQFRLCSAPMTSSMLEPNIPLLRRFTQLEEVTTVTSRCEMKTRRLDDLLPEMGGRIDFLKLDVQGYELAVLHGAEKALRDVLVIHTEVEFVEMYERQPLFAEVDQFLRRAGFVFHKFDSIHGRPMKPIFFKDNPLRPISQCMWADAVYVRDLWDLRDYTVSQLLRTALILHEIYHAYDAVHHVLDKADAGLAKRYLDIVLGQSAA